jgi:hypothetical protein
MSRRRQGRRRRGGPRACGATPRAKAAERVGVNRRDHMRVSHSVLSRPGRPSRPSSLALSPLPTLQALSNSSPLYADCSSLLLSPPAPRLCAPLSRRPPARRSTARCASRSSSSTARPSSFSVHLSGWRTHAHRAQAVFRSNDDRELERRTRSRERLWEEQQHRLDTFRARADENVPVGA